jgi:uncharacterized protein YjbI with pentapeptide repeats
MAYADPVSHQLTGATLTGANLTDTVLVPSDQTVLATTSSAGALVTWPTPQPLSGANPGTCMPPSGYTFPVGTTTVTCPILDDQGNVATGTFTVEVIQVPCNRLAGCNLSRFNLSDAKLAGADLQGANLNRANLTGAALTGANLTGTNLNRANLMGTNLTGAIVTVDTNFNVVTWSGTTCTDGTNSNNDGGTCSSVSGWPMQSSVRSASHVGALTAVAASCRHPPAAVHSHI